MRDIQVFLETLTSYVMDSNRAVGMYPRSREYHPMLFCISIYSWRDGACPAVSGGSLAPARYFRPLQMTDSMDDGMLALFSFWRRDVNAAIRVAWARWSVQQYRWRWVSGSIKQSGHSGDWAVGLNL